MCLVIMPVIMIEGPMSHTVAVCQNVTAIALHRLQGCGFLWFDQTHPHWKGWASSALKAQRTVEIYRNVDTQSLCLCSNTTLHTTDVCHGLKAMSDHWKVKQRQTTQLFAKAQLSIRPSIIHTPLVLRRVTGICWSLYPALFGRKAGEAQLCEAERIFPVIGLANFVQNWPIFLVRMKISLLIILYKLLTLWTSQKCTTCIYIHKKWFYW